MEVPGWEGMPDATFRRLTGVRKRTFAAMVAVLKHAETRSSRDNRIFDQISTTS